VPIQPPSHAELVRIADEYRLGLSEQELAMFAELAGPALAGFGRLDELPDESLPVSYPRRDIGHRPVGGENRRMGGAGSGAAEGPLAGRTVRVKDNVCAAGVPMLNGSPIMEGYVPREDATVVTRLLDAGAHIVGKTAVPAFCFDGGGLTGYPDPQPTNPRDPAYLCGASSNGSAAVVVTGEAELALGGDQGGSIRLPSSWSGCCGHKPTHGLVPYTGIIPIEVTLDHIGPMAMTVADCAVMLEAIAGEDGLDPRQVGVVTQCYTRGLEVGADGLRVRVLSEGFGIPEVSEPDVDAAVRVAADALGRAGAAPAVTITQSPSSSRCCSAAISPIATTTTTTPRRRTWGGDCASATTRRSSATTCS
jgi:amidase